MKKHIYYAIFHVLTVLSSIIFVTTTVGFNLPLMLILSGVGTLIFMICTKKELPIVCSISGSYTAGIIAVSATYGAEYAVGGTLLAGLIYIVVGLLIKKYPNILNLFPKYILSVAVLLISLNLLPIGVNVASTQPVTALVTLIAVLIASMISKVKTYSFPIALTIGTLFHAVTVGLTPSAMATELALTFPKFNLYSFTLIGSVAFCILFEALGDCRLMADSVGKELKPHRVILGNGLATFVGSLFGGAPLTSYTESVAYVRDTKHFSPVSIVISAILLIVLGFIPQLTMLISYIPTACFGALLIYLFSMVMINTVNTLDFANERQIKVCIIAIAFFFIGPVAIPSISPIALGILTATVANKVLK